MSLSVGTKYETKAIMANNAKTKMKTAVVLGTSALAIDTFAGNKTVVNKSKDFLTKFSEKNPNVLKYLNNTKNKISNFAGNIKNKENVKKITEKVKNSGIREKLKSKVKSLAENVSKTSKQNKKLAIITATAFLIGGIFTAGNRKNEEIIKKN